MVVNFWWTGVRWNREGNGSPEKQSAIINDWNIVSESRQRWERERVTRARWRSGERGDMRHDIQWSHYLSGQHTSGTGGAPLLSTIMIWSSPWLWLRNKISTQLPRCWAALCLINDLIISNTVFQIAVTTLSLAPAGTGIASRGSGSHLGGDIAPGPAARHTNSWKMTRKNKHVATTVSWARDFYSHKFPTNWQSVIGWMRAQGVSHVVSGTGCKCL